MVMLYLILSMINDTKKEKMNKLAEQEHTEENNVSEEKKQ